MRYPADSYSMVALLVVSIYLIHIYRHSDFHLKSIGYIGLFLSLGSFVYHATGTWFGQILDVTGMLLFSAHYLAMTVRRLVNLQPLYLVTLFVILVISSVGLMLMEHNLGLIFFTAQLIFAFVAEFFLYRRDRAIVDYKPFFRAIIWFSLGLIAWILDFFNIICYPHNHVLTGHSVWHISNAVVFYYTALFMQQFDVR